MHFLARTWWRASLQWGRPGKENQPDCLINSFASTHITNGTFAITQCVSGEQGSLYHAHAQNHLNLWSYGFCQLDITRPTGSKHSPKTSPWPITLALVEVFRLNQAIKPGLGPQHRAHTSQYYIYNKKKKVLFKNYKLVKGPFIYIGKAFAWQQNTFMVFRYWTEIPIQISLKLLEDPVIFLLDTFSWGKNCSQVYQSHAHSHPIRGHGFRRGHVIHMCTSTRIIHY